MSTVDLNAEDARVRAKLEAPDALARAARYYANIGVAVFPLWPGGKSPQVAKAHPEDTVLQRECKRACGKDGHGLYDATTDAGRVEEWWSRWPQANIGLRTGLLFDVLDIDGPTGMWTYVNQIVHGNCPRIPDTDRPACCLDGHDCAGDGTTLAEVTGGVLAVSRTAGENGGLHLYMRPTGDSNGTHVMPNIDYRGAYGYVVAPPSRGKIGIYTWDIPLTPAGLAAAA